MESFIVISRSVYILSSLLTLMACNSSEPLSASLRPTLTPTFVLANYATPTLAIPSPSPSLTPTVAPSSTPSRLATPTDPATASLATAVVETDSFEASATPLQPVPATSTPVPTASPTDPPPTPTETAEPTPAPLTGRIAFPVDDGLGNYNVWVLELPADEPFLVQPRARQPNFSVDGRLLLKIQDTTLGESIGLLSPTYSWQGIINQSPEDSYPFWHPDGMRYAYSNANLALDPDTAHLAPFIFTVCSTELPKFENSERCQDLKRWGKIVVGEAPVWTEDDRIAFYSYKGDDGIYFVESASVLRDAGGLGPPKLLVRANGLPSDTAGAQLFFSAGDIDGNWEAYAIDLDGANLRNLSNAPEAQDGLPTVSPDGSWVAFVSDRGGRWAIWLVPRSGGAATKLIEMPTANPGASPWGTERRAWMTERISWGP